MSGLDVGGVVINTTKGGKIEIGVASDKVTIHVDPEDWDGSVRTIDRMIRLHNYAKAIKAGILPQKPVEPGTEIPGEDLDSKVNRCGN